MYTHHSIYKNTSTYPFIPEISISKLTVLYMAVLIACNTALLSAAFCTQNEDWTIFSNSAFPLQLSFVQSNPSNK